MHTLRTSLAHVLLLSRQDLIDRHRENTLGAAWLLIQPLTFVVLFSTVFSQFMRTRIGADADPYLYTVYLIGGLLTWNLFANLLNRLTPVYSSKAHLIRKISVDLWLMPLHIVLAEWAVYAITMAFFAMFLLVIGHPIGMQWLMLPVIALLLSAFAYGIGIVLGTLDVFIPDIKNVLNVVLQFGFWLTPVVYLASILPPWAAKGLHFSPIFWAIDSVHAIIVWHQYPQPKELLALFGAAVLSLLAGRLLLTRLQSELRDTL
ncbi:ABC transporter permease [Paraburkholderia youngii]|uniref:Transport permease protein n=1 Tax=Paraburkholderia youngii TaxID=2782701 RepID=A0A7W8L9W5_9BURK|nr:ABC transporter permease [Paraburkholderia youngii]MBB5401771.1 lipopolysaccharide transport system permease protein [Paraburkholderia youngii]